jgi:hypothetical protein
MKSHFDSLPEYAYRIAHKLDLYVGIAAGVIFLLVAYFTSIDEHTVATVTVVIAAASLSLSGYGVYREEREMRASREDAVRLEITVGSWSWLGDARRIDFSSYLQWTVWVDQQTHLSEIELTVFGLKDGSWRTAWRRRRERLYGLAPKSLDSDEEDRGKEDYRYRRNIKHEDCPFDDGGHFEHSFSAGSYGNHEFELAVKSGSPAGWHVTKVAVDWDEVRSRGQKRSRRP